MGGVMGDFVVFERVMALPVVGAGAGEALVVEVTWEGGAGALDGAGAVQVYVDGELSEVSAEVGRGGVWLVLDGARDHRVELLVVPVELAWVSRARALGWWGVSVVREESWPVDAQVVVRVDEEEAARGALWAGDAARSGFGGLFGYGGFGVDAATGPGLGGGELGMGPLGADGDAWAWRGRGLSEGEHEVALAVVGEDGAELGEVTELGVVSVDAVPASVAGVRMDEDFTLRWLAEGEVW